MTANRVAPMLVPMALGLLVSAPMVAQTRLTVAPITYERRQSLEPARCRFVAAGQLHDMQLSSTTCEHNSVPVDSPVEIEVSLQNEYVHRRVQLRAGWDEAARYLELHVVKEDQSWLFADLQTARYRLDHGEVDRALAFLSFVVDRYTFLEVNGYHVALEYNYARALHNSCKNEALKYDTCAAAGSQLEILLDECRRETETYNNAQVTCSGIERDLDDLRDYLDNQQIDAVLATWERADVETAYDRGGEDARAAAVAVGELIVGYPANAEIWEAHGKPLAALELDAGRLWYRYASWLNSEAETDARIEALRTAETHLQAALDRGWRKQAGSTLQYVRAELRRYEP